MKTKSIIIMRTAGISLFAMALAANPNAARSQDLTPGEQWNQDYRSDFEVPVSPLYTGRSPYMKSAEKPQPAKPGNVTVTIAAPKTMCSETITGPVHLSKTMPAEATVGQEFQADLKATAVECVANVVFTDFVPTGLTYLRSQPPATVDGDKLVWKLAKMDAGQTVSAKVWFRAEKEGTLVNCATVKADPRTCIGIVVGKAVLSITKSGPAEVRINEAVPFTVVVKNTGTSIAKNVVFTDNVPDGLTAEGGQKQLSFPLGELAPGQSKSIAVPLKATDKGGNFCNTAEVVAANAAKVEAKACVDVVKNLLNITKTTPDKKLIIGKTATYAISVSNPGDRKQTGVVLTDTAAVGSTITEAQGATISGNTATWNVGDVDVGATKNFTVKVQSRTPGNYCDTAKVSSTQGSTASAQDCSEWMGVTGILVEMIDDPDPIPVGDKSKYTIRVTNQGSTRAIDGLKIVATLADELDIVPGSISDGGTISGKTITWPTAPSVAPKAFVTRTYSAKGVKAGDARSKLNVTTSMRPDPIEKFESTTVY